ncbi:MAG TPA: ion transporter [Bacteroidales bacterium]|nr:ion transporter [Bacteroidales bacterium]
MQNKSSNSIKSLFLNDHFILMLIVANALLIFVQEFDLNGNILDYFEPVFTLLFVVEMVVKIIDKGFKNYISDPWNRLDFVLIIISIPSIAAIFFTNSILNLNVFLALRVFRVFKFFRLIRFFPHVSTFIASIQRALKASYIVIAGFCLIIFMVSIVTCALYKNVVPEYFSNPVKAFYSIFRLFSVEGWYEIPDLIALRTNMIIAFFSKLYFAVLLMGGGIIGLSLVNSIFVDAMVSDNTHELEKKVTQLTEKIEKLTEKIEELTKTKQ